MVNIAINNIWDRCKSKNCATFEDFCSESCLNMFFLSDRPFQSLCSLQTMGIARWITVSNVLRATYHNDYYRQVVAFVQYMVSLFRFTKNFCWGYIDMWKPRAAAKITRFAALHKPKRNERPYAENQRVGKRVSTIFQGESEVWLSTFVLKDWISSLYTVYDNYPGFYLGFVFPGGIENDLATPKATFPSLWKRETTMLDKLTVGFWFPLS